MSRSQQQQTTTIANGAALSGAIDIRGLRLSSIQMPTGWTAAAITFQGALDGDDSAVGATFQDMYDGGGTEVSITTAASRTIVKLTVGFDLAGVRWLKVRSGTTGSPVNQGAARNLILGFEDMSPPN